MRPSKTQFYRNPNFCAVCQFICTGGVLWKQINMVRGLVQGGANSWTTPPPLPHSDQYLHNTNKSRSWCTKMVQFALRVLPRILGCALDTKVFNIINPSLQKRVKTSRHNQFPFCNTVTVTARLLLCLMLDILRSLATLSHIYIYVHILIFSASLSYNVDT